MSVSELPAVPRSRLAELRKQCRAPGEASFFYFDPEHGSEAVKILPGEYFVAGDDLLIMTTLGSCIATCLWDRHARVGGMNHFMLPDGAGQGGRYGAHAMEVLVNEMMKRGAMRASMEAKVFGGAQVVAGMTSLNVGERNAAFAIEYLKSERIPIMSRDLLGLHARRVCFEPSSGKAMVKRLSAAQADEPVAQRVLAESTGGATHLF